MKIDAQDIDLKWFSDFCAAPEPLEIAPEVLQQLARDRESVTRITAGQHPVYGLNTGLGANLGHRLDPAEITAFQAEIIRGRNVATGPFLDARTGRGVVLSRLTTARNGGSGLSPALYQFLADFLARGLAPAIPETGSIGASDLTQNAAFAALVIGEGQVWRKGELVPALQALQDSALTPPALQPKEAMALINFSGVTLSLAARALSRAARALEFQTRIIALTYEAYGAGTGVLRDEIQQARPGPGQIAFARRLSDLLEGADIAPRRIQEAISFRAIAPLMGALSDIHEKAVLIWSIEVNSPADSPLILQSGEMLSTANFHTSALALALENLCLALAGGSHAAQQRMQRLMNPDLSGLPRYLSPAGEASAGMVPLQKTAAALLTRIRHLALPIAFDPAPVSDQVEDIAPQTPLVADKLLNMLKEIEYLLTMEALVATQALDLRAPKSASQSTTELRKNVRSVAPMLEGDRSLGPDLRALHAVLFPPI